LPIPGLMLMGVAHLNDALHRATGDVAMLTPGKVREMLHADWTSRDGAVTAATGWRPRIDLDQGFAETIAWYRRNGWL
jgi:nucleoside-diphosphate-sugar epimerase